MGEEKVSIRFLPFERADFDQLIQWIPDARFLLQWGGPHFTFPLNESQLEEYIKNTNKTGASRFINKVVDSSGVTVGHISLGSVDRHNRSARIGKVLVGEQKNRGQGIGRKMIKEICHISFDELNMHRVSLGVWDFNKPAIRCYEKAGFVHEGIKRDLRRFGDEYWSLCEMSILEDEWKLQKKTTL
ncbi:GNAT family N-acetyltransferase [Alteribacillus sp. JSM 102045]|uniref:GNAT family N-acetyltransferase n=1 Tax=Alteribacillus sp. JSM 102045 TaxID=1562101 RepID=UPI0035C0C44B